MTGCYRFVGRDCAPTPQGMCERCGCPISDRSQFKADGWTCRATRLVPFKEAVRRATVQVEPRTAESLRAERFVKPRPRIAEALAETRAAKVPT